MDGEPIQGDQVMGEGRLKDNRTHHPQSPGFTIVVRRMLLSLQRLLIKA
jgi:hypothetical protein